jgi:hypothetical protein
MIICFIYIRLYACFPVKSQEVNPSLMNGKSGSNGECAKFPIGNYTIHFPVPFPILKTESQGLCAKLS